MVTEIVDQNHPKIKFAQEYHTRCNCSICTFWGTLNRSNDNKSFHCSLSLQVQGTLFKRILDTEFRFVSTGIRISVLPDFFRLSLSVTLVGMITCSITPIEKVVESWLNEHPQFVHAYFARKATRRMVDSWLLFHSAPQDMIQDNSWFTNNSPGAVTPVRKTSAHELESKADFSR
ncbi:phosphodiesterase [Caerostris darwini]|uniref:Phosphodiesterase n=1 Tax=Caerostris darwini TaxID=1538125 RepID=A0AAV4QEY7_9ARAC|nr:phosphodiesterase [Caerostris darwini]